MKKQPDEPLIVVQVLHVLTLVLLAVTLLIVALTACFLFGGFIQNQAVLSSTATSLPVASTKLRWTAPDSSELENLPNAALIKYGRDLIRNTSYYFGPKGKIASISNGMNCQNCHLNAGTKYFGNNYSAVAANYPKFRERSGVVEGIFARIQDCFERSLNGKMPDTSTREIEAIKAYILWLGKDVPSKTKPDGAGLKELAYLARAADPMRGKKVFITQCGRCHGNDGEGKLRGDKISYEYPPLWGMHSYNTGAGLFRLSRFASYVKYNMPFGVNDDAPQLSDEQAWDIAAFVNSNKRPHKTFKQDWPVIAGKPIDHPFGPYADPFTERQHKYGPFPPIDEYRNRSLVAVK